jgi:hypothetical protein
MKKSHKNKRNKNKNKRVTIKGKRKKKIKWNERNKKENKKRNLRTWIIACTMGRRFRLWDLRGKQELAAWDLRGKHRQVAPVRSFRTGRFPRHLLPVLGSEPAFTRTAHNLGNSPKRHPWPGVRARATPSRWRSGLFFFFYLHRLLPVLLGQKFQIVGF